MNKGKYNILIAQMSISGIDRSALAEAVGMHYNTLCRKMRGENEFTVDEAIRIKEVLGFSSSLEELFKREARA